VAGALCHPDGELPQHDMARRRIAYRRSAQDGKVGARCCKDGVVVLWSGEYWANEFWLSAVRRNRAKVSDEAMSAVRLMEQVPVEYASPLRLHNACDCSIIQGNLTAV
jgi:hypothetical protein